MLQKMRYMANTARPVFRELSLSPTSSLQTKTSSPSEWEAEHSRVGQNSSLLGCTPCARARHMLGIPEAVFLPRGSPAPFLCATKMVPARGFALW